MTNQSSFLQEVEKKIRLNREQIRRASWNPDETETKRKLILPVLKVLGWDELNIIPEFGQILGDRRAGKRVDYALFRSLTFGDRTPTVIVEGKKLRHRLEGKDESQLRKYATILKPDYAVLTNGKTWSIYELINDTAPNLRTVDIIAIEYDAPSETAKRLCRISNRLINGE